MGAILLPTLLALFSAPMAQELAPPPAPGHELLICPYETLGELLARWAREVGVVLSFSAETERLLGQSRPGVLDDLRVPPEWGNAVLGRLLAEQAYVLHPITARVGPVFRVTSLDTAERSAPRRGCAATREALVSGQVMAALEVELIARFEHLDPLLLQRDLPRVLSSRCPAFVLVAGDEAWIRTNAENAARLLTVLDAADRAAGGAAQEEAWPGAVVTLATLREPQCDLRWHPTKFGPRPGRLPNALDVLELWARGTGEGLVIDLDSRRRLAAIPIEGGTIELPAGRAPLEVAALLAEAEAALELWFEIPDPAVSAIYAVSAYESSTHAAARAGASVALDQLEGLIPEPALATRAVTTAYVPQHRDAWTLAALVDADLRTLRAKERVELSPVGPKLVVLQGRAGVVAERVALLREFDREEKGRDEDR